MQLMITPLHVSQMMLCALITSCSKPSPDFFLPDILVQVNLNLICTYIYSFSRHFYPKRLTIGEYLKANKKKEKGCISRLHAKKQINQGSAISQTFTSYESLWTSGAAVAYILPSLWILYGQEDNSSTVQIMLIFCQLRLVSILSTLNQT